MTEKLHRRQFHKLALAGVAGVAASSLESAAAADKSELNYALASSMYGTLPLAEIVPQVRLAGATHLDLWPRPHGNQREQLDELGPAAFQELLASHNVRLGMLTRYDLGPFRLEEEIEVARQLGGQLIVTGSGGPKGLTGSELKDALRQFMQKMQPIIAAAEEAQITVGIENHANALLESPDSLRWFAELSPSDRLGVALAPYHLPQDPDLIAGLITDLGPRLVHFYAWQHGTGSHTEQPKEQELLQMPGRGPLDFAPLLVALKQVQFAGWTEIFMHPFPRGIPILPTAAEVTAEINRSRAYLAGLPSA